ncbi:MAG: hypothetical protein WC095_00590 [Candidatus Paceibacterota bacterium]|jgi:hypothetical protein
MSQLVIASWNTKDETGDQITWNPRHQVGEVIKGITDHFERVFPDQRAIVVGITTSEEWVNCVTSLNPEAKPVVEESARIWKDKYTYYVVKTD